MLATLRDARGNTTIQGLDWDASWQGVDYAAEQFRTDAHVLDGVDLVGTAPVQDMLWARPAANVLGIDCPPVVGSTAAIPAQARAGSASAFRPARTPIKPRTPSSPI